MQLKFIEVTNKQQNWGKFLVARFDEAEWAYQSQFVPHSLLREVGWGHDNIIVFDLQTREGAAFRPGGLAVADLEKHSMVLSNVRAFFKMALHSRPYGFK